MDIKLALTIEKNVIEKAKNYTMLWEIKTKQNKPFARILKSKVTNGVEVVAWLKVAGRLDFLLKIASDKNEQIR